MNVSERNEFLGSMYACIHTITVYLSVTEDEIKRIDLKELRKNQYVSTCIYRSDTERLYLKLNLNKGIPDNDMILRFREYRKRLEELMNSIGYDMSDLTVTRADLCINSNLDRSYERYRKLLKYILCCCYYELDLKNGYETRDPLSFTHLNLKFSNRNFEIENYNKEIESHGSVPTRNRLELRSKKLNCTVDKLPEELKKKNGVIGWRWHWIRHRRYRKILTRKSKKYIEMTRRKPLTVLLISIGIVSLRDHSYEIC